MELGITGSLYRWIVYPIVHNGITKKYLASILMVVGHSIPLIDTESKTFREACFKKPISDLLDHSDKCMYYLKV